MTEEYAARVCSDGRVQTVREHTNGVCAKAQIDAKLIECRSIVTLICLLHDMGKNTAYSNEYQHAVGVGKEWSYDKPIHSHAGAKFIFEHYFLTDKAESPFAIILSELTETLVMSHHGLFDCLRPTSKAGEFNVLIKKLKNDDYDFQEAQRLTLENIVSAAKIDELFHSGAEEIRNIYSKIENIQTQNSEKSFYLSMLFRMLLSILVNADHTDAAEFSSGEAVSSVYDNNTLWEQCCNYLSIRLSTLSLRTPIQKLRGDISQKSLEAADKERRVVRLNVPTGGGKTLSSLRFAVNYAKNFRKSRIVYVAPFNSILEQNSAVFKIFLPDNVEILEHFGDMIDFEEGNQNYRYYTENWGSPIIATSMVQFLNTLFSGKITSVRRMRGLINSVIILDEIQSVPVECISLLNLAINFLTEICECTVVLCSATQPALGEVKHKILMSGNGELIENNTKYVLQFKRTRIFDSRTKYGYTYEEAANFVLELSRQSKSVLLIVNTKDASTTVYNILRERLSAYGLCDEYELVHLSTHMCPAHRKVVLSTLRERLNGEKKVICVSTQLIEAGVDISFETVVRSMAGLDSIIQAAGRCNRNQETALGNVHIVNLSEENISKIKTIQSGAAITRRMLELLQKNPTIFHGDIAGEEAVSFYYQTYFEETKEELDYRVTVNGNLETTLYRLLSNNRDVKNLAKAYNDSNFNFCFNQSFKTAGEAFKTIDDYHHAVVVPYGQGIELIAQLCSANPSVKSVSFFRALQQYSIGLSDRECEGRVTKDDETGILILKDGFYTVEYGFDPEGKPETLFI